MGNRPSDRFLRCVDERLAGGEPIHGDRGAAQPATLPRGIQTDRVVQQPKGNFQVMTNDGFFPIQLSEGMNRSFYQNEKFASHWQEIKSPCPAGGGGGRECPNRSGTAWLRRLCTAQEDLDDPPSRY